MPAHLKFSSVAHLLIWARALAMGWASEKPMPVTVIDEECRREMSPHSALNGIHVHVIENVIRLLAAQTNVNEPVRTVAYSLTQFIFSST